MRTYLGTYSLLIPILWRRLGYVFLSPGQPFLNWFCGGIGMDVYRRREERERERERERESGGLN